MFSIFQYSNGCRLALHPAFIEIFLPCRPALRQELRTHRAMACYPHSMHCATSEQLTSNRLRQRLSKRFVAG